MNYEIQNLSRRLVSVHCNSGKTCHLPPGEKYQVPEQEITGNPSVKKLEDRKLIRAQKVSQAPTGKLATKKATKKAAKKATKVGAKSAKASSKKKSSRKKSPSRKKFQSSK